MNLQFTYNSETLESGIECANKANVAASIASSFASKINSDSIPKDFSASGLLTSTLSNIFNTNLNISLLPDKLVNIKNILDLVAEDKLDSSVMSTLINSNMKIVKATKLGYEVKTEDNLTMRLIKSSELNFKLKSDSSDLGVQDGFLLVPDGYTDEQLQSMNLAMTVYIGGNDGSYNGYSGIFHHGEGKNPNVLPRALEDSAITMKSIVYFPSMLQCDVGVNSGIIQDNVEAIASYYNVDADRISAAGVSDGGRAILRLAEMNPNYYSVVATAGADDQYWVSDLTKSPDTKFIFACGSEDDAYNNIERMTNEINSSGGQAIYYQVSGVGHNQGCRDMFNTELLNDMVNSKKTERADSSILGVHQVSEVDYKASSAVLYGQNEAATPLFYKSIV